MSSSLDSRRRLGTPPVRDCILAWLVAGAGLLVFLRLDRPTGAVLMVIPWLALTVAGIAARYRTALEEHRNQAVRLAERNAIAGELHDRVTHHVSAIAVQAQAAQFVAAADPEEALNAMRSVETVANSTIDEMRRMTGMLHSADHHTRTVVPADLAQLEADDDPPVRFSGETSLDQLPAPVAVAVHRIVVEAVGNARRHNRRVGTIDVRLQTGDDRATVEIVNDGTRTTRSRGNGYGLIGMEERVEALGGTIEAGPLGSAGWRVCATIPIRRSRTVKR